MTRTWTGREVVVTFKVENEVRTIRYWTGSEESDAAALVTCIGWWVGDWEDDGAEIIKAEITKKEVYTDEY